MESAALWGAGYTWDKWRSPWHAVGPQRRVVSIPPDPSSVALSVCESTAAFSDEFDSIYGHKDFFVVVDVKCRAKSGGSAQSQTLVPAAALPLCAVTSGQFCSMLTSESPLFNEAAQTDKLPGPSRDQMLEPDGHVITPVSSTKL